MRTYCYALLVAFSSIHPLSAQVSIGNRGGVALFRGVLDVPNGFEDGFKKNYTNLLGISIAMPIEIMVSDHFAIQPEVGYTMKHRIYNRWNYMQPTTLNYLDFTLLAKARITRGRLQGELMLGPGLAHGLRVRHHASPHSNYQQFDPSYTFADTDFAPMEIFLAGGVGLSYAVGVPRIFINYRYVYGLTNIQELDSPVIDDMFRMVDGVREYNRGSIISLGFLVPLSRNAWKPAE